MKARAIKGIYALFFKTKLFLKTNLMTENLLLYDDKMINAER